MECRVFYLPTDYHATIRLSNIDGGGDSDHPQPEPEKSKSAVLASDLAVAQQRLSDGSTLVHEIVLRRGSPAGRPLLPRPTRSSVTHPTSGAGDSDSVSLGDDDPATSLSRRLTTSGPSGLLPDLVDLEKDKSRGGVLRVGMRPDDSGSLRLDVRSAEDWRVVW